MRLVELARRSGTPAHLVEDTGAVRVEWVREARVIGVTAGASAPPRLVEDLVTALRRAGPVDVEDRRADVETIRFLPPLSPREP